MTIKGYIALIVLALFYILSICIRGKRRSYEWVFVTNFFMFFCFFMVTNFIYEYAQKNTTNTSLFKTLLEVIPWIMVAILTIIIFIYILVIKSGKVKNVLIYMCIHIFTLVTVTAGTIFVKFTIKFFSILSLNFFMLLLLILNMIFQTICYYKIKENEVSIKHEIKMLFKREEE